MLSSGRADATPGIFRISSMSLSVIGIIWPPKPKSKPPDDFFLFPSAPFSRWTVSVRSASSVSKNLRTWTWRPRPSEIISTSDATPTTTPAAVRIVRPLRRARFAQAMPIVSAAVIGQHLSVAELDRPARERVRERPVVRDDEDRLPRQRLHQLEDLRGGLRVEVARGLV